MVRTRSPASPLVRAGRPSRTAVTNEVPWAATEYQNGTATVPVATVRSPANVEPQVADPEGLSLQLMLLVDGAIAAALVRRDPTVARAAGTAARTLLAAAGVSFN